MAPTLFSPAIPKMKLNTYPPLLTGAAERLKTLSFRQSAASLFGKWGRSIHGRNTQTVKRKQDELMGLRKIGLEISWFFRYTCCMLDFAFDDVL